MPKSIATGCTRTFRHCNFRSRTRPANCRRPFRYRRADLIRHRAERRILSARDAVEVGAMPGDRRRPHSALPVAQAGNAAHQRARHSRRADAGDHRLSHDGRCARGAAAGGGAEGPRLGAPLLEPVFWQDRGDRRRRRDWDCDREITQGIRDACRRRHAHAARDRRFRRNHADRSAQGSRGARGLSDQHPAGDEGQSAPVRSRRSSLP